MVTVAVPPLHVIGVVTAAVAVIAVGCATSMVPVTGPQLAASVTLHGCAAPAATVAKMPVALVIPFKVLDNGAVPPVAVMVAVAVPPLHVIGVVTAAVAVIAVGCATSMVPVTGPQVAASVKLHGWAP